MRCIFERQVEQLFVFNTALPSVNLTDKCVPCGSVPDCCIVNRYGIPCMLSHLRCSKQTVVSTTGSYVSRAGQGKTANTHNQYTSEMSCMQKNTRLTYSNWLQHWGMAYPGMYAHVKQLNKSAYLVEHISNIFFIDNSHKILAPWFFYTVYLMNFFVTCIFYCVSGCKFIPANTSLCAPMGKKAQWTDK